MNQQTRQATNADRLPQVRRQWVDSDVMHLLLYVDPDLPCFVGHFPTIPLVPGVFQVDWAVRFAGINLLSVNSIKLLRLKFQRPMFPGTQVTLSLNITGASNRLEFCFYDEKGGVSSGVFLMGDLDVSTLRGYSGI